MARQYAGGHKFEWFCYGTNGSSGFWSGIGLGVGSRSIYQGYAGQKAARFGYGTTENDSGTGQQHTWYRKLETEAGRWSTPDPYNGSMTPFDPQSLNRYSYVRNDPTNNIDPSGLECREFNAYTDGM